MSNLFTSMSVASNALDVYRQALDVVQNNLMNSNTPGYAKQTLALSAQPFDLTSGMPGGVAAMGVESARDEYAEQEVRRQTQTLGWFTGQAEGLSTFESSFDVTGQSGLPLALNNLIQGFSAWSVNPTSGDARQSVIDYATTFASQVSSLSTSLSGAANSVQSQIRDTVDQINKLASSIALFNSQRAANPNDAGQDANLHANLEELSKLVDITTLNNSDGTVSVVLGSGSALVLGDTAYSVTAGLGDNSKLANPQGMQPTVITDWQGKDITASITGGTLGGSLDVRNRVLASIIGDGQQTGSLNTLAKTFADTVNGILTSGTTAPGGSAGVPLFTYDNSDATLAASTLKVSSTITADTLAPVDSAGNANGNALKLASLANSTDAGSVDGVTFLSYFGQIASSVGRESSQAQEGQTSQQDVVTQTQALRNSVSGVSLDEQAVALMQFQRSYQAVAQVLRTLDSLLDSTMSIVQ